MAAEKSRWSFSPRALVFSLVTLLTLLLLAWSTPQWAQSLDRAVFDGFQRAEPRLYDPDAPVRIVDIDSASLAEIGQWPWPRTYLAELVERLDALGAAAIAFDVLFAEPDRTSPSEIVRSWRRFESAQAIPDLAGLRDHDERFAEAIRAAPVVLGIILTREESASAPTVRASFSRLGPAPDPYLPRFGGAAVNLPAFSQAAAGIGTITLTERSGGLVRAAPLLARAGDQVVPLLAMEALRVAQGAPGYLVKSVGASGEIGGEGGMVSLRVGAFEVPTRYDGGLWVRYAGPDPRRTISAARLLADDWATQEMADAIAGRLVFIGTSAPGLRDLVATPLTDSELGVAVHAEIIEQIVSGEYLLRPDWASGLEVAGLLALGLSIAVLTAFEVPLLAFAMAVAAALGAFAASWYAFTQHSLLLGPVWPALGALLPWASGALVNYVRSEEEKRAVRRQFTHFLAPEVVDEIARDPARYLNPGGEQRELTILFCDIRSFSTVSKDMNPQELIAFLNDFLTPMTDVIVDHGGTIDKYMGDSIMAFWNAPKPREDHRRLAVAASLAMQSAGARLNAESRAQDRPPISFGIGLNSGMCSVGSIGSRRRLDYTCIGDAVNVASRLEGLTKQYGIDLVLAEDVARGAGDAPGLALFELDTVTVVGRDDRLERIFTALDGIASTAPQMLARAALSAYRGRDAIAAIGHFRALAAAEPRLDGYAAVMIERCERMVGDPPPANWDGVYRAEQK